jgi:hypothetical protein
VQLGANNCTVIVGFNAQLLKYFTETLSVTPAFTLTSVSQDNADLEEVVSYGLEVYNQQFGGVR